jgi:nucleoside-diphosphate-sugar epimerase
MKVLVLGGTGAMGAHLVRLLSGEGEEIWVTSRRRRSSEGKVHYLQGDAHEMGFIEEVLQRHWDAIVDFMVYKTPEFEARAGLLMDATAHYLFLSSARVYAKSNIPLKESAERLLDVSDDEEYLATDDYALAKARQENILKGSGRTNWTVIRPYITYSDNRLQLGVLEKEEWLYRALQGRTIVFSSDINTKKTTMTYGLDVAEGMLAVIGKPSAMGEIFHITSPESIAWHDVLAVYLDVLEQKLGRRPKVKFQDLERFMTSKRAPHQIKYDRLFDREFDSSKISRHLDITRFTKVRIGLEHCLKCFLEKSEFQYIDWSYEALRDRQTKEHASLKEIRGLREKARYLLYRYIKRSK